MENGLYRCIYHIIYERFSSSLGGFCICDFRLTLVSGPRASSPAEKRKGRLAEKGAVAKEGAAAFPSRTAAGNRPFARPGHMVQN